MVDQSIRQIHELVGELRGSGESLEGLQQDVKGIVGVLDVIRAIAEQTNLLALNAAIEAPVRVRPGAASPWSPTKFARWPAAPSKAPARSRA